MLAFAFNSKSLRTPDLRTGLGRVAAILVLVAAPLAHGDSSQTKLNAVQLFTRCYSHMTSTPPAPNEPLLLQVKAGSLSAMNACMKLFDEATLQSSGSNVGMLVNDTPEGRAVFQTFTHFNRTWFPSDDMNASTPDGFETTYRNAQLYDETEAAYHIDRALFTPGVNYSEIVTGTSPMEAIRTNGPSDYETTVADTLRFKTATSQNFQGGQNASFADLNAQLVQWGMPIGVRPMSANPTKMNQMVTDTAGIEIEAASGQSYGPYVDTVAPQALNASLGGGIMGTQSYLLLNFGRATNTPSDGGLNMPRRWAKNVFHDLLCRNIPVMRLSDAASLVQTVTTAYTPPFRLASSCMQCHGTMDNMAKVVRNVSYLRSPVVLGTADQTFVSMYVWPTTLSAETNPVDLDPTFFERPTNGTLMYRSYDGTLVTDNLTSIADLGAAFASSNDLYACAAAQYYQFFTGDGVNLQDIGDPNNPPLSQDELTYRQDVIQLGQTLKSTQSLRSLIQAIISLPIYQTRSMRYPGP